MRKGRLFRYSIVLVGFMILLSFPIALTWRVVYLERLNRRLVTAVKLNDTVRVTDLLEQGADANMHDDPRREVPLWQRLLEALHFKQKPTSDAPSVLRLALEWRPGSHHPIKPTIEETQLIQVLRKHGARLDGPEIIAYMARTYAFCSTYQDIGHLDDRFGRISFQTAFIRPDRFFFEYRQPPKERYVLWEDRHSVYSWWTSDPRVVKEESLEMGIGGATGNSLGIADMVPSLLIPERMDGWASLNTNYPKARLTGTKSVDGVVCYEVVPSGGTVATLYIDTRTFLLRKVAEGSSTGSDETIILFYPQVDGPISEQRFRGSPPR